MKTLTAFFMAIALMGLSVSCDRGDGFQREEESPIIDEAGDDLEEAGHEIEDKLED